MDPAAGAGWQPPMAHGGWARGGLLALIWIGVPAVWLVVSGVVGAHLSSDAAIYGIGVLCLGLFVGLPLTVVALSRALLGGRREARGGGAIRARRPPLRQIRPPEVPEAPRAPRPPIGARRRVAAGGVLSVMFVISLGLWTAVPLGWVWIGSQLAGTRQPAMAPYLLIIAGIPATIVLLIGLLYRLDAAYARLIGVQLRHSTRAAWLKSLNAERQRRPWTTADAVMTVSVIVALLCAFVWFMVFADQHSVIGQYLQ
jgi:hypothetical protein